MMTKEITKTFNHIPGVHCTSSALRNVLEFHGLTFSEAMVFGLGSGMTISYMNMRGADPMFGGRNHKYEKTLFENLGIDYIIYTSNDKKEGWLRLKSWLDRGIPSAINVEMHYLDYRGLYEDFYFGMHGVVVTGYDDQMAYIADTELRDIQALNINQFHRSRSSTHNRWLDPRNMIFEINAVPDKVDMKEVITRAVNHQGKVLSKRSGLMRFMGIHGGIGAIDKFANDLPSWLDLDREQLELQCQLAKGYISDYGTGGGMFRLLYSRFLRECSEILADSQLDDLAALYLSIGEKWDEVGLMLLEIPTSANKSNLMTQLQSRLSELKDLEKEAAGRLREF